MPRGAPKGNKYAKKAEGESERGLTFSYYMDAYEYEFLQKSVEYDGKKPTDANVRKKAKALAKEAIRQDMVRTFARYKVQREAEEQSAAIALEGEEEYLEERGSTVEQRMMFYVCQKGTGDYGAYSYEPTARKAIAEVARIYGLPQASIEWEIKQVPFNAEQEGKVIDLQ